jgi:hypothetical protein
MEFALIDHSPRAAILAKSRIRVLVAIATLFDRVERLLPGWSGAHRQQHQRAGDQAGGVEPQELVVCWQSTRRSNRIYIGQPDKYLPPARCRPATVSYPATGELAVGAHK